MEKNKNSLLNESGVTLVGLIVTVVVMLIIAGVSIYNGISSIDSTKLKGFYTQLEIVQKRVDDIFATDEQYIDENGQEVSIKAKGESLTQSQIENLHNIVQIEQINITNAQIGEFRYFSTEDIENVLDLREIEYDLFINFEDRIIIAEKGITLQGITYYALKNKTYFVEPNINPNTVVVENLKYTDPIKYGKDTYKVTVIPDEINGELNGKEYVKYKDANTKYWETSTNKQIIIKKHTPYNLNYYYNNKVIEKIIKIDYKKDQDDNVIKDENGNPILVVVEMTQEKESEENLDEKES